MNRVICFTLILILFPACTDNASRLVSQAEKIHEKTLTVDTHCDTPINIARSDFDLGMKHAEGCIDFPRMKEGGLDAEFFAVFTSQGPRNDSAYNAIYEYALEVLDKVRSNVEQYPDMAGIATSPGDALRLKKEGKISAFIGIENGYPIGLDLSRVKAFYNRGARYITLSHTRNNDICDSSTDPRGPEHDGLSEFGKKVVAEMNRLGMMVDVSHISDNAFYDVLEVSEAPVIASHSSCRALCESPRNLDDDMLLALRDNGGVIQICILSAYLKIPDPNPQLDARLREFAEKYGDFALLGEEERKIAREEHRAIKERYEKLATVKDVADHIDHVVQVIGIDHVGIGTDFDGGGGVEGCMSVADMKNITIELLQRGYSKSDIARIWGGNIMRVMKEAESLREAAL
ncbi:MAG TPA: membrane dipeptidase [Bacteroidales bacterium]|nr:membrane dipeptidase [Bacteroidales bacterium]